MVRRSGDHERRERGFATRPLDEVHTAFNAETPSEYDFSQISIKKGPGGMLMTLN